MMPGLGALSFIFGLWTFYVWLVLFDVGFAAPGVSGSRILRSARNCYSKVQQSETACTGAGIQLTVVWIVGVQNVV